jgi:predicted phosphodiesterase
MGRILKSKTELAKSCILKNPTGTPTALGKKLFKDYPYEFNTLEDARDTVRRLIGKKGAYHRGNTHKDFTALISEMRKELPKGESEKTEPYHLPKSCTRILVLSDIHLPYQDDDALFAALQFGLEKDVNCIYLNGDTMDMYQLSRHEKNPANRSFSYELDICRSLLKGIRKMFPNAHIVYKIGNHDERYEKFIRMNPQLISVQEFELGNLLGFPELRIHEVKSKQWSYAGKMPLLHGHELPAKSGGVNPARMAQLKLNKQVIIGHFHRETKSTGKQFDDKPYAAYSSGCLCDLYPAYMPINDWNHGFTYLEVDPKNGNYYVQQKTIVDGKIY